MLECATTVELCAVRATRLGSDGTVSIHPDNVYIVQDVIQLQMTPNIIEGEERTMAGGCGCNIAQKTDPDNFRRYDLELQTGRWEPGFLEMMLSAVVIEDTNGPIGVQTGLKLSCGVSADRVAFEAWSKRWTADDEQDPNFPWIHWLFPSVAWVEGQNTLQADFSPIVLAGKTRANTAWGFGPYGDEPVTSGAYHRTAWAADEDLPTATCDYSTVAT